MSDLYRTEPTCSQSPIELPSSLPGYKEVENDQVLKFFSGKNSQNMSDHALTFT